MYYMYIIYAYIYTYTFDLHTQNPQLREIDLEPSPKRASDNINMQKQGRNIQKKASQILQTELTYESQHLQR